MPPDLNANLRNLKRKNYGHPDKKQLQSLQDLTRPHVDSFNYMLREGLTRSVKNILPVEFALPSGRRVSLHINDASISNPAVAKGNMHACTLKVFPVECRERGITYRGRLQLHFEWRLDGRIMGSEDRDVGEVPIMVKSSACSLSRMTPTQLVQHGEEAEEMGGYFIVNGIEKIVRMLVMPRRNYPTAITRSSYKNRGPLYTEYGVTMRCVKDDQSSTTVVLHYLNNGTATLGFTYFKDQFFVPIVVVLKALLDTTDKHIYDELIKGKEDDSFYKGCLGHMLRQAQEEDLCEKKDILRYIGKAFRVKTPVPEWYTDIEAAEFLVRECICPHLQTAADKFNILVFMTHKLYTFARGQCTTESADNPMFQEVLLSGHLYQMVLKEKIESWLTSVRYAIERQASHKGRAFVLDTTAMNGALGHTLDISRSMNYLMATGNLISKSGLGLMQATGLVVVADKLNFMRYISHFRCIHRGAFFAEMRTTSVRRLLPEAWGFICPVHTPDGAPCGLMNHMAATCQVVNHTCVTTHLAALLCRLGMEPVGGPGPADCRQYSPVLLDGRFLGWLPDTGVRAAAEQLRLMKVKAVENIPRMMEIGYVAKTPVASQYPGLFLFTSLARMMRPVHNLAQGCVEMIGTFEQVYLDICVTPEEAHEGETTHQELSETSMLSALGSLTPYSDFNQSPRNMYQCQMGKQTMGTPCHALAHRSDNKLYRIQTPQSPLVRPAAHDLYAMDNYPLGTNAIVAVISYTGYDMEDAMILNKSAYERGFCHGSIYKSEFVDLRSISRERSKVSLIFGCQPGKKCPGLDADGLPPIGAYLEEGTAYYSYINVQTGESKVVMYKAQEPAYVDQIKVLGSDLGTDELQKICIVLRITRNPVIGDKFSSRHGQKGICSQKWPVQNMPFSESGMTPDILFNPHGFPSRMTIGMMIESMAGKSAAMHGLCHDATAFTFSEDQPAIDYFGQCLTKAGYNYHGTERLYSGVDGREFEADIFMGLVYYQRLRHMVSDKFQVRTTGAIDQLTHQPVKGRKRGGGVRFGEMERDTMIAHGTAFLLHDRLFRCSDESLARVCVKCGSLLSPCLERPAAATAAASFEAARLWTCLTCKRQDTIKLVRVPYVFRYLTAELAAMNIKTTLKVRET